MPHYGLLSDVATQDFALNAMGRGTIICPDGDTSGYTNLGFIYVVIPETDNPMVPDYAVYEARVTLNKGTQAYDTYKNILDVSLNDACDRIGEELVAHNYMGSHDRHTHPTTMMLRRIDSTAGEAIEIFLLTNIRRLDILGTVGDFYDNYVGPVARTFNLVPA